MKSIEEIYDDYLFYCYVANQYLTGEDWHYYGKEEHHIVVSKREGGLLHPLNSQYLTTYQHWIAGVLQSEVSGKCCFAYVPKNRLPPMLEILRAKWRAQPRGPHTEERKEKIGNGNRGKKLKEKTIQLLKQNYFDNSGWFWVTNGEEETMVAPDANIPTGWRKGRKEKSKEVRSFLSSRFSGENNPMYGVEPKSKKMRWFKILNPLAEKMFIPGEEPKGWVKGRITALDRAENRTLLLTPDTL